MNPWARIHIIRNYEAGPNGRLAPYHLANYFNEAAGIHAEKLGWGIDSMQEDGETWVMTRFYLNINRLPAAGEKVVVRTRPSGADRVQAYRDFDMATPDGEILVLGTSAWVIIKLNVRRPVPTPQKIQELGEQFGSRWLKLPDQKLRLPSKSGAEFGFKVRKTDLDINNHVNNAVYIGWVTESVPENIYEKSELRELDVVFRAEAFYGDEVVCRTGPETEGYMHVLNRKDEEKHIVIARSTWS
jgi:medium-chain acyl-[acyl-carrier-protein] hydrolase